MSFISKLLGKSEPSASPPPAEAPPVSAVDSPTAAKMAAGEKEQAQSFVCHVPVLDRTRSISGYGLNMPEDVQRRIQNDFEFLQKIYDDAVLRNLVSIGGESLLGRRLAFVRLAPESLDNPRVFQLPTSNTVLIIAPAQQMPASEQIQPHLNALRQAGFVYGWLVNHAQMGKYPQLLELAACGDYLQVDASSFNGMDLKLLLRSLTTSRPADLARLILMATELNTFDEFNLYFYAGFDYFLGQFVTNRQNWQPQKSEINRLHVIRLLNLLREEVESDLLAKELKHDPVLSFKFLRYLNSPVMGLQKPVTSMDKALLLLGREKFYRWLSLLLFNFKTLSYREKILTEQALSRAYFLESLAGLGNLPEQKDQLFMLGLFSLLDLLMGQPMAELLQQAKLPPPVHDALLDQPGLFHDALLLAKASEGSAPADIQDQAAKCGLDAQQVSLCLTQALSWAHEISLLESTST